MKNFLCLATSGWKWVKRIMLFKQHCLLSCIVCFQMFQFMQDEKNTLSSFSVSPSMHNRSLSEQRCWKAKITPEAYWRFPSWKTRKCFHVRVEFISLSWGIHSCTAPLTEEVMSRQTPEADIVHIMVWRTITHRLCPISLKVPLSSCLSDIPSLFPLLISGNRARPESGLHEMAMDLRSRKLICKIRVKSAKMIGWKNHLCPEIRMSEYLLLWDLWPTVHQEATRLRASYSPLSFSTRILWKTSVKST